MAQEVPSVIAQGGDEAVRVETIVLPDPGPGEVAKAFTRMRGGDVLRSAVVL
jgi:hypothetical protein